MHSIVVADLYERGAPRQEGPVGWKWPNELYGGEITLSILASEDRLECAYRRTNDGEITRAIDIEVPVTWKPCNLGGRRALLHCPECGQGVRILYLTVRRISLSCRTCANLCYRSQLQSRYERAAARAQMARSRLGSETRFGQRDPPKPKGMHWRTYDRRCSAIRVAERGYLDEVKSEAMQLGLAEKLLLAALERDRLSEQ